jgi:alcohol dehydrogenase class IV
MKRLLQDLSLPLRLRDCGAKKEDFQTFSETVLKLYPHHINNNPRDMRAKDVKQVYENAW